MSLNIQRLTPNFLSTKNMSLTLNSWSSVQTTLKLRGITENSVLDYTSITNSDRSKASSTFNLPQFPLSFTIFSDDTGLTRGELYVQVNINIDGVKFGTLTQTNYKNNWGESYVSDSFTPQMGYLEDSLNGSGKVYVVTGDKFKIKFLKSFPAADTEISITVPTKQKIIGELLNILCRYAVWNVKNVGVLLNQSASSGSTSLIKKIRVLEITWSVLQAGTTNAIFKSSSGGGSAGSGNVPHIRKIYVFLVEYFSTYPVRGIIDVISRYNSKEPQGYSAPMGSLGFRLGPGDLIVTDVPNMHASDDFLSPYILEIDISVSREFEEWLQE